MAELKINGVIDHASFIPKKILKANDLNGYFSQPLNSTKSILSILEPFYANYDTSSEATKTIDIMQVDNTELTKTLTTCVSGLTKAKNQSNDIVGLSITKDSSDNISASLVYADATTTNSNGIVISKTLTSIKSLDDTHPIELGLIKSNNDYSKITIKQNSDSSSPYSQVLYESKKNNTTRTLDFDNLCDNNTSLNNKSLDWKDGKIILRKSNYPNDIFTSIESDAIVTFGFISSSELEVYNDNKYIRLEAGQERICFENVTEGNITYFGRSQIQYLYRTYFISMHFSFKTALNDFEFGFYLNAPLNTLEGAPTWESVLQDTNGYVFFDETKPNRISLFFNSLYEANLLPTRVEMPYDPNVSSYTDVCFYLLTIGNIYGITFGKFNGGKGYIYYTTSQSMLTNKITYDSLDYGKCCYYIKSLTSINSN